MKLVIIRMVPLEIMESYLESISPMISQETNGDYDLTFPFDYYDDVISHPTTRDLMSDSHITFEVEVIEV